MNVVVVSTGGTIAMRPDQATGKLVPAVSGEELVEMLAWPETPPLELGGDLAGPKAHVLLQLALGAGLDAAAALVVEAG